MDLSGIPAPAVAGRDVAAARELLERCIAAAEAPEDAARAEALAEAERKLRRGPVLRAGEILDRRFLLLEPAAQGPLSTTWRGWDLRGHAPIDVEVLHPQHMVDPLLVSRFRAGPAVQARLAGADLAEVVEPAGEWEGFPYAAYAAPGQTLAKRLGSLDPRDRLAIVLAIAEAVARIHAAGEVHGALSPDAVRLADDGRVLLTGLGLHGPGGRGLYTPPEAANPAWTATPQADVHVLALVALAVLRDAALPYWVVREPGRVVDETEAPPEVLSLLQRMLHWRDEERPTAAEVCGTLLGDADRRLELARRAVAAGRAELAVARYRSALALRPDDPTLRRELATALAAAGSPGEAAELLADALAAPDVAPDALAAGVEILRGLVATTGDPAPLLRTLEALAASGRPGHEAALFEIARFRDRSGEPSAEAWEAALAAHRTRAQAREALERLVELAAAADDARAVVRWGRELGPYVDDPAATAALCHRLGHAFLDRLEDPDNGLLWLDRALVAGHPDPELPMLVRRLRTARGEWSATVDLLEAEAARTRGDEALALLRNAAGTARWALADEERAARVYAKVLALAPSDDEALRHLAQRARLDGRFEECAAALRQLAAPRPIDACRAIDAWMNAGRPDEARRAFDAGRAAWPDHVGLLQRGLVLLLQTGDEPALARVAEALVDRVGPGTPGRREAQLVLADAARRERRLEEAARRYQEVLEDDAFDGGAWWGLVQVAWAAGRTGAEPAWLRAAPRCFPAQEALARLIGGLVAPGAVQTWLALDDDLWPDPDAGRLEHAAAVVDRLVRRGLVDGALFDRLAALAGDQQGWVEAVRRLWNGSERADVAFPVAAAHAWCPVDGPDLFRGTHRVPIGPGPAGPTRPPGILAEPSSWSALLVRDERAALSEEGDVPAELEPERRPVIRGDGGVEIAVDPLAIAGSGPAARIALPSGPPERCRFEHRGGRVYVAAREPVQVDGVAVTEARLEDGAEIDIDGVRFTFVADAPVFAVTPAPVDPPIELEELELDETPIEGTFDEPPEEFLLPEEPTDGATEPAEPIRAALFYRADGSERILPLAGEKVEIGIGPDGAIRVGDGGEWLARVTHPDLGRFLLEIAGEDGPGGPGSPRLLAHGESFTVGGTTFEFHLVEARTPAPPPPREIVEEDLVPILLLDEQVIPVLRDGFTIGRGRRNDLQLAADGRLSRHHCTILLAADGAVRVRDAGSSNGTFVNGEPIDERLLDEGDVIGIGDTDLVFRRVPRKGLVGPLPEGEVGNLDPFLEEDDEDSDEEVALEIDTRAAKRGAPVTVEDGRVKLQAANAALAMVVTALDRVHGPGRGRADLQLAVDAAPRRFAPLFSGVEARATGLPEMIVLYNVAQRPAAAQRPLMNEALLDLVERFVAGAVEALPGEEVDPLLEALSATRYREQLRL